LLKGAGPGALAGESATGADRDIAEQRPRSNSTSPMAAPALALRPYQIECIEDLRRAFVGGRRAPVLQLPTGAGKTIVLAEVIRLAAAKERRVLLLVHRRELIRQTAAKLALADVPHGIIAAEFEPDPEALVQVASVQSLVRRADTLVDVDLVIIDEAHHGRAKLWHCLVERYPKARLLGATATPARLDGRGLGVEDGGLFDVLVTGPSTRDLIFHGYLSPTRCFVPRRRLELAGVRSRAGDYVTSDLVLRVDRPEIAGDAVEQYALHADHLPCIAYCCNVAHAKSVAAAFRTAGYRAECVHGDLKVRDRDRLIAGLGTGEIELLTSGDLISEGLDVPNVGAVILLRPTKSLTLYLQQVGRGMRPAPGKDALVVLDHVGNVIEHGLPDQERKWSLAGVEEIKKPPLTVLANGEAVRLRREITEVADELKELSQGRLDAVARMPYWEAVYAGLSEAELRHYARVRRYKRGWVSRILRAQRAFAP
jgi:DNA repair protein RadD